MSSYLLSGVTIALAVSLFGAMHQTASAQERERQPTRVIIDSDANNELDDQHAIAYALMSEAFDVAGITVNRTANGGPLENHIREAERVVELVDRAGEVPILEGASGSFREIAPHLDEPAHDGAEAVDFIIEQAHAQENGRLVVVPIGKLTNVALALEKDPSIASRIRIVWLGSNFPEPGEYNLENDTSAVNPVIESGAPFEVAVVRYSRSSGTAAVQTFIPEVRARMAGKGPEVEPVEGRQGGTFTNFGDYSVELFEKAGDHARALYDVAALSVVKDPSWAVRREVGPYRLVDGQWVRQDEGEGFAIWELFHTSKILDDFFRTMEAEGRP